MLPNLNSLRIISKKNNATPILKQSFKFINKLINENKTKTILELGTGCGYSAYLFSNNKNIKQIISLEKDKKKYRIANKFLKSKKNIELINKDLFIYQPKQKFDLIFVDACKSNQDKIVKKYAQFLNLKGLIIIDNIYLCNLQKKQNKQAQKIVKKNEIFVNWLNNTYKNNFKIINVGDGVGLLRNIHL